MNQIRGKVKFLSGAVAAIVIVGSSFVASPALASSAQSPTVAVSTVAESGLPVQPAPPNGVPQGNVAAPHPLGVPADLGAASLASPQGKSSASSTGEVGGALTLAPNGTPLGAGVTVVAMLFADITGAIKFSSETKTASDGRWAITGLAPADYWILFYDDTNPGVPTAQWYGSSAFDPYGSSVAVADGQHVALDWALTPSGEVSGTVACEGCAQPPLPADFVVYVAEFDPSRNGWYNVASAQPDSTGKYDIQVLYPGLYYSYARFTGASEYSRLGYSYDYTVNARSLAHGDVIIPRLISAISGVQPAVNSVVNALYWDFLTRLPGQSEVSFWNSQFAHGAGLGDVSAGFVNSDEYRLIRIDAAYQSILGRSSDANGRLDWLHWMQQGKITTDDIETSFYASQEYFLQHGGTNVTFVQSLYKTLLHRDGGSSDYAFWVNLVQTYGRAWVIGQFWSSTETISERVSLMYAKYLGRTPDPEGLKSWVGLALQIGDSGLRSGLTGNGEYFVRSQYRYSEQ